MADNGIRALAPIIATPGTALSTVLTVPAGKEWTFRLIRATNVAAADATVTVSIGASGEIANNAPVAVGASINILGPDFLTLPPGATIQARASSANAVRLVVGVMERDL